MPHNVAPATTSTTLSSEAVLTKARLERRKRKKLFPEVDPNEMCGFFRVSVIYVFDGSPRGLGFCVCCFKRNASCLRCKE